MSETHLEFYPAEKKELYALLKEQLTALTDGEPHVIPNLANASALIYDALSDVNWAGFYTVETDSSTGKEYLLLGPFQGKTACIRIPSGRGVCGTAMATGEIQLIKNVHEFPGHIACDSASNSEIVLPIYKEGKVVAVLDIDSPKLSRFDEEDKNGLQKLVEILEKACEF
ncbi:MAG: GAF domain-containing protein [Lachnospiraceae bacterium]|nr:GAF domain-containing protein [Lachnospiraceae bacterium]